MYLFMAVLGAVVLFGSVVSNNGIDVSTSEFLEKARSTYSKVQNCVESSWMMEGKSSFDWHFPDDAQHHFEEIRNRTERFRHAPIHEYAAYEGPWIENIFIRDFIDRPLSFYNGFIPIFIQWIDSQILRGHHFDNIHHELNQILRPNVLYLAISQGDVGLGKIGSSHPNIMVLSAGGYGHVPLPLVRGEIPMVVPTKYEQDIGFFGNTRQASRPDMLSIIQGTAKEMNLSFKQGTGPSWQRDMEVTRFNLAPRGYGRSSFRYAEAIQMGRVPVFLYDDHAWAPYSGTNISAEKIGFIAGLNVPGDLVQMVHHLKQLTASQYEDKLRALADARWHYTYPGVTHQIELFVSDPFGRNGGNLRCVRHPHTERCCGRR